MPTQPQDKPTQEPESDETMYKLPFDIEYKHDPELGQSYKHGIVIGLPGVLKITLANIVLGVSEENDYQSTGRNFYPVEFVTCAHSITRNRTTAMNLDMEGQFILRFDKTDQDLIKVSIDPDTLQSRLRIPKTQIPSVTLPKAYVVHRLLDCYTSICKRLEESGILDPADKGSIDDILEEIS